MRLKDSKLAIAVVVFSLVGWPVLVVFRDSLPGQLAKMLAIMLLVSLIVIPTFGYYLHSKGTSGAKNKKHNSVRRVAAILTIILALVISAFVFIYIFFPLLQTR